MSLTRPKVGLKKSWSLFMEGPSESIWERFDLTCSKTVLKVNLPFPHHRH